MRRLAVQNALIWLKDNYHAYSDIIINDETLKTLPVDGECSTIATVAFSEDAEHNNDQGPAPEQTDPGATDAATHSSVLLPDKLVDLK